MECILWSGPKSDGPRIFRYMDIGYFHFTELRTSMKEKESIPKTQFSNTVDQIEFCRMNAK